VWPPSAIESLRAQVRQIEGQHRRATPSLPFGVSAMDSRLAGGALALGALHEIAGGGNGAIDGAAAALFAARDRRPHARQGALVSLATGLVCAGACASRAERRPRYLSRGR
jgi:hypothetical protein